MMSTHFSTRKPNHRQDGFTLLEIFLALSISAIVVGGIIQTYANVKLGYKLQKTMGQLQESGRYSVGIMVQDLRRTGYLNGNTGQYAIGGTSPPINPTVFCDTSNNDWARMLSQPIFGLDDTNTPYNLANGCIPDADYNGGDVLVLRYTSPAQANIAEMNAPVNTNRLYLRTSLFQGRLFDGKDNAANTILDTSQRVSEVSAFAYYIGNSTQQCQGVAIPALFRIALNANGLPVRQEMMRGIERLQVQYGIGPDHSVTQYVDADNVADWNQVIAVRIWLLTRGYCPDSPSPNTKQFAMGNQAAYAPNDRYHRRLFSSTAMLRNGR